MVGRSYKPREQLRRDRRGRKSEGGLSIGHRNGLPLARTIRAGAEQYDETKNDAPTGSLTWGDFFFQSTLLAKSD